MERLEGPGGDSQRGGVFSSTSIEQIELPSTLKVMGAGIFYKCKRLKCVTFREGSKLEEIGIKCFGSSGIEEITVPNSATIICAGAFERCEALCKV